MTDNTPLSEQEALLDDRISEMDATQSSMDDTPFGNPVDSALLTLASCVFDAAEVLDYFEGTDELPEALRNKLVILMHAMHHMLLVMHGRAAGRQD